MLLFHDVYPWTAAMLPTFLRELKQRGYQVVHMVAGPGNRPDRRSAAGLDLGDRAHRRRAEAAIGEGARRR